MPPVEKAVTRARAHAGASARDPSSTEYVLRMTREEIGSYLGLKLDTVSRLFSRFHGEGLIQVQVRAVKLLDPATLKQIVGQRSLSSFH